METRGGPTLGLIYTEYVNYYQAGGQGAFLSAQSDQVEMIGPTVGVQIQFGNTNGTTTSANTSTFLSDASSLQNLGVMFTMGNVSTGTVEGFVPIYQLPSVAEDANVATLMPVYKPTTMPIPSASVAVPTGPTAVSDEAAVALKGGPGLASIYQDYLVYEQAGGTGTFSPTLASVIQVRGTSVGVDIRTTPADFTAMLGAMEAYGMDVTATAPQIGLIEGFLPIAQLPTVATNGDLTAMSPIYKASRF